MNTISDIVDKAHCQRIAAGAKWSAANASSESYAARGSALDVSIRVLTHGERIEAAAGSVGEEVAAILEGSFSVTAADEHYELSVGEGIIIPPREPRTWICTSGRGVLYRALTLGAATIPGAGDEENAR